MADKSGARTAKAAADAADPASMGRIKQIRLVAGIVRKQNPRALPLVALIGVGILIVCVLIGLFTHLLGIFIPLGIFGGLTGSVVAFGRFAQSSQMKMLEGQPGAGAAILQSMRGNWTVTPAIAGNRNMDIVHRVVGRPGVILVGEGSPSRLPSLLAAEKRRMSRIAHNLPIYDIQVGDAEGQIPIKSLQKHLMKLPRNLKGQAVAELNFRLNALPAALQMPKGPMPKTGRMPKPPRPKMR